jgi:hypothetical protein
MYSGKDFNFTINAKNEEDYRNILLNINKIKKLLYSKTDLLVYNYLYYHYDINVFDNVVRKINLKKIDFTTTKGLIEFGKNY